MKATNFAIRHPVIVTIISITVLVLGFASLQLMNKEFIPDISMPGIMVVTLYPGVGAGQVEEEVTDVLEEALATLSGLKAMSSTSRDSVSTIQLDFPDGTDTLPLLPEVREKINAIRKDLPDGISGEPALYQYGSNLLPVLSISVSGGIPVMELTRFVEDEVIPSLSRVPGVSRAVLNGGVRPELKIELDLDQLYAKEIGVMDVYNTMRYHNVSLPAGEATFRDRELYLKTEGKYSSLKELRNLTVGFRDGAYIHLRDVARLIRSAPPPKALATVNGNRGMVINIMKRPDGDTIAISGEIRDYLDRTAEEMGGAVDFNILKDDSDMVDMALSNVISAAGLGIIMAMAVIFLFLHNLRYTLIIGISLPMSILASFIFMKLAGQTQNILSFAGLSIALGMVVDASIVILENFHKKVQLGDSPRQAAAEGTDEVGGAVIASTTTTVTVFAPLIALSGIVGIIMRDLSLTLVFALLTAMASALLIVPVMATKLIGKKNPPRLERFYSYYETRFERGMEHLYRFYRYLLNKALNNRRFILTIALLVLLISGLTLRLMGITFIPSTDVGEVYLFVTTPEGFSLEQTHTKVEILEKQARQLIPEIEESFFFTGYADDTATQPVPNKAYGKLLLRDKRKRRVNEIIPLLQEELQSSVTDVDLLVLNGGFDKLVGMATGGTGFRIELSGNNLPTLMLAAETVDYILRDDPDTVKTEMNTSFNRQEMTADLALDYLGNLGLTPYEAALTARILFHGLDIGEFDSPDETLPITLTSGIRGREVTDEILDKIVFQSQSGKMISFSSVAEFTVAPALSAIHHNNRMKTIAVTAHLKGEDTKGITERVTEQMEALNLPFGVTWTLGGTGDLIGSSFRSLALVLGLSVFLVYVVLVVQFERFLQPFIVMLSIPFCLIGVVGGLLLFGSNISIIAFLAVIALAGIVVNNAIVLIDYMNLLRKRDGLPLRQAIIQGAVSRLKPILMTTLTTMLGILPLAFARGNGSEIYSPLGQAIAGGLLSSTLITLFLIPVLYSLWEEEGRQG